MSGKAQIKIQSKIPKQSKNESQNQIIDRLYNVERYVCVYFFNCQNYNTDQEGIFLQAQKSLLGSKYMILIFETECQDLNKNQ